MQLRMVINHLSYFFAYIVVLAFPNLSYSQTSSYNQLEQKVYQLNNELKYNQSQALLLPVLQDDAFSADEKYQAAILLSYTYKRVFDYQSTLKFLAVARKFARETPKKDQYLATIQAEEAFVLFDTHEYQKSDSLMATLEKSGFRHIDQENKSKLVMQQGYLLFLNKEYVKAERTYDKAIHWMQTAAPCHLPMILVKKMQLYHAMNRMDLLDKAFRKSLSYADSCKIIKYYLYTYEELSDIYKARNNTAALLSVQQKIDSLNTIYAREQNISSLHNQKENILDQYNDRKLQYEQIIKRYLTIILISLSLIVFGLFGWLINYRKKQRLIESDFNRRKSELENYIRTQRTLSPDQEVVLPTGNQNELSERQQEVLQCMALGMSNKAIADKLFISENTVKYHIKNIYFLLDIKDRKEFLIKVKK